MERLIRPALPVMVLLAATVAGAEVREVPAWVQQGLRGQ